MILPKEFYYTLEDKIEDLILCFDEEMAKKKYAGYSVFKGAGNLRKFIKFLSRYLVEFIRDYEF